jgi:dihydrofolate reductase
MKTSVFCGISVDGFLARRDGTLDFLDHGGQEPHGYEEFIATIDVLVMGRNTYEWVLAFSGGWPFDKPVFVLSSHEIKPAPAGAVVEHLSGDPKDIVAALESRGFKHAYIDGGVTIQRFLRAGLIDRLIATRVPVLIGEGIPLFGPVPKDILLEHVATRTYKTGLVQSEYRLAARE